MVSNYYENRLLRRVKSRGHLPKHIGIILDGNRRFARNMSLSSEKGHLLGAKKLEEVLEWAQDLDIQHMTVYAFSRENFRRSPEEVQTLMELLKEKFEEVAKDERVHENEIRVRAIGDLDSLPEDVRAAIREAERATEGYDSFSLNVAVGYGGRAELAEAVQEICGRVRDGKLDPEDVDQDLIGENLYTADLPDPDLIIRTSGEERLSGFLLWQSAYSELYFCEANWPGFDRINFLRAIYNYQGRERRFGE
ncbi:UDP diphosphate synthase [candidate division MSBL1 archaeon SCGC-AAA259E19]|uniref:Tritrans,polycis-undecaprenyl-diphosphate synthase (geranylgeranyl-diphosphate specific) n=1 Tax=candidate division MSBL1 archaeon SCGC-AAA259E19 TaxID=1698264 RepID=A0A133UMR2_9EURY|nr:UDP diphosphate synthase [candidate division MSBL1 archaeon SCGC-AAA259E19]